MPANDAVATAAVARREVRNSLDRLEYHLGRGSRGRRGVEREVRLLDALHRQAVQNAGKSVGRSFIARPQESFGQKAVAALSSGNTARIGRAKSSVLADFSADVLKPVRDEAGRLGKWTWVTNASACPSCLSRHGYDFSGPFIPLHPSCLCIAAPQGTPGLRPLSRQEIIQTHEQYGLSRYNAAVGRVKRGEADLLSLRRLENVNESAKGLGAVGQHAAKQEVSQLGLPGGLADDLAGAAPPAPPEPFVGDDVVMTGNTVSSLEMNKKHYDWWDALDVDEQSAVEAYTSERHAIGNYRILNKYIAKDTPAAKRAFLESEQLANPRLAEMSLDELQERIENQINTLVGALDKWDTSFPGERMVTYRQMRPVPSTTEFLQECEAAWASGGTVTHTPFASTTINTAMGLAAPDPVLRPFIEIHSKSCAYLDPHSKFEGELEWLIQPGKEFYVRKITRWFSNPAYGVDRSHDIYQLIEK